MCISKKDEIIDLKERAVMTNNVKNNTNITTKNI